MKDSGKCEDSSEEEKNSLRVEAKNGQIWGLWLFFFTTETSSEFME